MDSEQTKQMILRAVQRRPHTLAELQNNLQLPGAQLRTLLAQLAAQGLVARRGGVYVPGPGPTAAKPAAGGAAPAGGDLLACTLIKLAPRFGFAARDDGEGEIFIPGRFANVR